MKYVVGGNVMLDTVRFADGTAHLRESIGGPATFAYSGIKLWTDDVLQCSKVGEDYHTLFDPWIRKNHVETAGFKVMCQRSNHSHLVYFEDGTYGADDTFQEDLRSDVGQDFGYLKTSPADLEVFTRAGGVQGVYVAQNCDKIFWNQLGRIKERDGFRVMWEIEAPSAHLRYLDQVRYACRVADIFSINIQEAQNLFGVEGDEACIRELQTLDVDVTLFRVGERGLYSVTRDQAIYLPPAPGPVVDPTGCGNTSTGAALYAYVQGKDPLMIGIMANVAAAQNLRQFGVIEDFAAVRQEAFAQAEELYDYYNTIRKKKHDAL